MWIYKIKIVDGKPMYKARLVAKGYAQKEGIDFQEVFSLVVKMITLHVLFVLITALDLELLQMDVKTTFLYGDLDEELYMKQIRICHSWKRASGMQAKRSLYRLKYAPDNGIRSLMILCSNMVQKKPCRAHFVH